ncbi:MAG TPA: hypothetical protein HPP51_03055 [Planctomycetes bacterium]|nr:hypothetical protein [Planctomycetota bacterium]
MSRDKGIQVVSVDLNYADAMKLAAQLNDRMEQLGHAAGDWAALDLGFELPANWPTDKDSLPTLPQLTVMAYKLGMRLVINGLDLYPQTKTKTK